MILECHTIMEPSFQIVQKRKFCNKYLKTDDRNSNSTNQWSDPIAPESLYLNDKLLNNQITGGPSIICENYNPNPPKSSSFVLYVPDLDMMSTKKT